MRVYFLRHGQSVSNATKGELDSRDPDVGDMLSEEGWQQARSLGKRLEHEGLTHLITSDMRRAKETAEGINEILKLPLEVRSGIQETNQGRKFHETLGFDRYEYTSAVVMEQHDDDPDFHLEGAESFSEIVGRVHALKRHLESFDEDDRVAVVSHGNFLRFFLGDSIMREDFRPRHFMKFWNVVATNTGISIFNYEEPRLIADGYEVGGWRLATWMDHAHL
jgi:broad specificity phosphatase PhoE